MCDCLKCSEFTDCGFINRIAREEKTLEAIRIVREVSSQNCPDFSLKINGDKHDFRTNKIWLRENIKLKKERLIMAKSSEKQGNGKQEKPMQTGKKDSGKSSGKKPKKPC